MVAEIRCPTDPVAAAFHRVSADSRSPPPAAEMGITRGLLAGWADPLITRIAHYLRRKSPEQGDFREFQPPPIVLRRIRDR
jgi:hypothetical protein